MLAQVQKRLIRSIVKKNSPLPMLGNVIIGKPQGTGFSYLFATDLDIQIATHGNGLRQDKVLVPYRTALECMGWDWQNGGNSVEFTSAENNKKLSVPAGCLEEFPAPTEISGNSFLVRLKWRELRKKLNFVLPAVSKDENRPHLTFIHFDKAGYIESTDAHRLHRAWIHTETELSDAVIPARAFSILKSLPNKSIDPDADVRIYIEQKKAVRISVRICNKTYLMDITASLRDVVKFPNTESVWPTGGLKAYELHVPSMIRLLRDAVKHAELKQVTLKPATDSYGDSCISVSASGFQAEAPGSVPGKVCYNGEYLIDILKNLDLDESEDAEFLLKSDYNKHPALIQRKGAEAPTLKALLMPIRPK